MTDAELAANLSQLAKYIDTLMTITARQARVTALLVFALLHTAVLVLLLLAAWWWQIHPAEVADFVRRIAQSNPVGLAAGLGLSAVGLLGAYWKGYAWLARKAWTRYLFHGARD